MASKSAIVIDTRLNDDGVKKGWQALLNNAKKLASQYNKSVDTLSKEEAELDKLKNKLDLITSGNTTPASIKAMESELKKTTKEAENLKKQLDSMEVDIDTKNAGLDMTKSMYGADSSQYQQELASRDALLQKDIEMGEQYDDLTSKAQTLADKIKEAKMDPSTTAEAQELANKIQLAEQKLGESKEQANGLKDKLADIAKTNFATIFSKGTNGIKSGFEAVGSKIDKLKTKMTRLALTAMVFSAIRNSLNNLRKDLGAMLMSNAQFASSLNQIKANLATAFAPIYNAILPALNALMSALSKITGTIATFVASLFGQTASQAQANAKALQAQKNATEGLAKAQGKLASFDTLEVNDASKSSGSGSNIDFSGEIKTDPSFLEWLNKVKETLASLFEPFRIAWDSVGGNVIASAKDAFSSVKLLLEDVGATFSRVWNSDTGVSMATHLLNIWTNINTIVGNVAKSVKKVWDENGRGEKLMKSILGAWDKILEVVDKITASLAEFALSEDFQRGLAWAMGILTNIYGIIGGIAQAFSGAWDEHGMEILKGYQSILNPILQLVESISGTIKEWVMSEDFQNAISTVADILQYILNKAGEIIQWVVDMYEKYLKPVIEEKVIPLINTIIKIVQAIWEKVKPVIDFIVDAIKTVLEPVIATLCDIIGGIIDVVQWVADLILGIINGDISGAFESFGQFAQDCWDNICGVFSAVGEWFNEHVIQPVKDFFTGMWDGLKEGAKNAWEGIKNVFSSVANFFKEIFQKAWEGVKKVFEVGGKIFDGIKDGIVNAFKTIVNGIITGINKVVEVPFNAINFALKKIHDIDILGVKPFGWLGTINVPQIPKLATGTVAYAPMVAQIGEYAGAKQNPEIVAPSDMIRQIVREEARGKEVVIEHLEIVSKIGEDVLRRQVMKNIRLEEQAIGKPLLLN